ncbi:dienelactone hydrolase family protein [Ophiostoma piceae UAMH 11346]|uniref:Dienelactone hydrolase family protein n=1 Tax=Ophiostoma piceae (strain UAMH 11346) TaxID=1262450 RepID=S3BU67_OPHP1|nr:dienelactone hydrolase family protein [Ophiostoma piceae UAMH 11346]
MKWLGWLGNLASSIFMGHYADTNHSFPIESLLVELGRTSTTARQDDKCKIDRPNLRLLHPLFYISIGPLPLVKSRGQESRSRNRLFRAFSSLAMRGAVRDVRGLRRSIALPWTRKFTEEHVEQEGQEEQEGIKGPIPSNLIHNNTTTTTTTTTTTIMSLSTCCVKGFTWDGTPEGREEKIATSFDTYVSGTSTKTAVLIVHDIYGWKATNARLLADHYAREAGVTAYLPDFFQGGVVVRESRPDLNNLEFLQQVILPFLGSHGRDVREPDVFAVARALKRDLGYEKVAVVGFCYGGWAAFRLGAAPANQPEDKDAATKGAIAGPLVDAVAVAHPSLLTTKDIDELVVPTLVLAPAVDALFSPALKQHTFDTLQKNGVPLDYIHFPVVEHGALVRGDVNIPGERAALVRAKHITVSFLKLNLSE